MTRVELDHATYDHSEDLEANVRMLVTQYLEALPPVLGVPKRRPVRMLVRFDFHDAWLAWDRAHEYAAALARLLDIDGRVAIVGRVVEANAGDERWSVALCEPAEAPPASS